MSLSARLLERPLAYRLWQAPFAEKKLEPVLRSTDLRDVRRVLDVGCGPGTNTRHFAEVDYLGLDINERYVEYARRRHGRPFVVADVTQQDLDLGESFDFILVNSFLHHVDTEAAQRILAKLRSLLLPDGHIHVLELVLPDRRSPAAALARADRGKYIRPLSAWMELLGSCFEAVALEQFDLSAAGVALWKMVYFKGRLPDPIHE